MLQSQPHKFLDGAFAHRWMPTVVSIYLGWLVFPAFASPVGEGPLPPSLPAMPAPPAAPPTINNVPGVTLGGQDMNEGTSKRTVVEVKSLFFAPEEMAALDNALDVYSRLASGQDVGDDGGEDFIKQLEGLNRQETETMYTYPQFFLESLVYHSMEDWSLRINGHVLNKDTVGNKLGLRILEVDKDKVMLEWKPVSLERFAAPEKGDENATVSVDRTRGTVNFTLRPNQTFSSYVMQVLEGKVKPVDMQTGVSDTDKTGAQVESLDQPLSPRSRIQQGASRMPQTPADKSDSGIGGLINIYKDLRGN